MHYFFDQKKAEWKKKSNIFIKNCYQIKQHNYLNAARQPFTTVTLNVVNIQKGNLHEILCTIISQNEMGKINL